MNLQALASPTERQPPVLKICGYTKSNRAARRDKLALHTAASPHHQERNQIKRIRATTRVPLLPAHTIHPPWCHTPMRRRAKTRPKPLKDKIARSHLKYLDSSNRSVRRYTASLNNKFRFSHGTQVVRPTSLALSAMECQRRHSSMRSTDFINEYDSALYLPPSFYISSFNSFFLSCDPLYCSRFCGCLRI